MTDPTTLAQTVLAAAKRSSGLPIIDRVGVLCALAEEHALDPETVTVSALRALARSISEIRAYSYMGRSLRTDIWMATYRAARRQIRMEMGIGHAATDV